MKLIKIMQIMDWERINIFEVRVVVFAISRPKPIVIIREQEAKRMSLQYKYVFIKQFHEMLRGFWDKT